MRRARRGGPMPGQRLSVAGEKPLVSVTIRVPLSMRQEWQKAAALVPESMAEFIRAAANDRAEIVRTPT